MSRPYTDLGNLAFGLKKLREEKGYSSSRAFADRYGLDPKQYWRMESGCHNYTLKSLINVLTIHEVSFRKFSGTYILHI